jgi:hypothetical protein
MKSLWRLFSTGVRALSGVLGSVGTAEKALTAVRIAKAALSNLFDEVFMEVRAMMLDSQKA